MRGLHPFNHDIPVKPRFIYLFYFLFLLVFSTYKFLFPINLGIFYAGTQAIVVSLFPFAFYSFKSANSTIFRFLSYSLCCFYIVYSFFVGTRTILICLSASLVLSHLLSRMSLNSFRFFLLFLFSLISSPFVVSTLLFRVALPVVNTSQITLDARPTVALKGDSRSFLYYAVLDNSDNSILLIREWFL